MVLLREALGDAHNFGRRVTKEEGRVHKPRALLWERLVLSAESPLRKLLDAAARKEGMDFGFLPDLAFSPSADDVGGEVEHVALAPLTDLAPAERGTLAAIVGRSLALWSWLGVSDLHWENLVLGRVGDGRIVFAPLDVEMILADLSLPTETKLLPDADPEYAVVCQHACGVRRVLPYLGKPVDGAGLLVIASAYVDTLAFLDRQSRAIADVFSALPELATTPIRVCLRGTDEYVNARVSSQAIWPPLLEEEEEQLARGDIPYFFRLYGRPGIHFYGDASLKNIKTLPLEGDVPQLDPILSLKKGLRAPSRKKLREEGLFTVLGAFDHPGIAGPHSHGALEVVFGAQHLDVKHLGPGGEELQAHRDMSDFVSSVYQPCECGEVRTVFVPATTKCAAAAESAF